MSSDIEKVLSKSMSLMVRKNTPEEVATVKKLVATHPSVQERQDGSMILEMLGLHIKES